MPCRKLFSSCPCGGELWVVMKDRTGLLVCRDCGDRKPACDDSAHPLLPPDAKEPRRARHPARAA